jgi:hypothetical protein
MALGCIVLGAAVGIPLAILGYRHSWAWGYAGVIVALGGFAIAAVAATLMTLFHRELRLRHLVVAAVVVAWVASTISSALHNHFQRIPDDQYMAGFSTGRYAAQAKEGLTDATAVCRKVATQDGPQPPQPRTSEARYVTGCVAGWKYQRAHPLSEPAEQQPAGVQFPTVRLN